MKRASDLYFKIEWPDLWGRDIYFEPLLIFISLPFRSESPRLKYRKEFIDEWTRKLLEVSESNCLHGRTLLRQFLTQARQFCSM